jgi:hypothetical protein
MQKLDSNEQVKVQHFTDIKPDESYIKDNSKRVVFPSLEEWAMLILKPPHQTRLEQAKDANAETKDRWNRCKIKIQDGYQFQLTQTDFTKEKEDKTDEQTQKPTLNYSNQSKEFLHAVIIDGLVSKLSLRYHNGLSASGGERLDPSSRKFIGLYVFSLVFCFIIVKPRR